MTTSVLMINPKSTLFVNTTSKQRMYVLALKLAGILENLVSYAVYFKNLSKIEHRKSPKKRCLPATNESTDNDSYVITIHEA